jgi:hypothetical protein
VKVANGDILLSSAEMLKVEWFLQGHSFQSDLKLISPQCFDMIVGMEWLERYSPMKVHWAQRWLTIPYQNSHITLQGMLPGVLDCNMIELLHLNSEESSMSKEDIPEEVHHIIQQFQLVFTITSELPPRRSCDHMIPLLPGATLVHIRSYIYAPALKGEIERQVQEMLQAGIIQSSASAFSSPVLLVKKKDGTWCFCIDYRGLNAITIKGKYPLLVIDELMDELAGYHQICLAQGEEYKTAFQTHFGQFEFKVITFRLCGAPNTFQGAMNATLALLVRKCALVFFDDILIYNNSLEDHVFHLKQVLQLLEQDHWQVKLSKCSFAHRQIDYLRHVISG